MTDPIQRLEGLGDMAREVDEENPSPEQRQEQAQQQAETEQAEQGAKDWAMIPFMIGGLVALIEPELQRVYTQERCLLWGQHANQVAVKHGWNSPSNMPELGLLACSMLFAVPTFLLLREKMAEMKEGKATGLAAKIGVWWRTRKAAKAAKAAAAAPDAAGHGSQQ